MEASLGNLLKIAIPSQIQNPKTLFIYSRQLSEEIITGPLVVS